MAYKCYYYNKTLKYRISKHVNCRYFPDLIIGFLCNYFDCKRFFSVGDCLNLEL